MSEHRAVITEQTAKHWTAVQVVGIVVSLVGVLASPLSASTQAF